jgi:hypothetical protein
MGIWTDLWRTRAAGWAYGHIGDEVPIDPEKRYVTVLLKQMWIVNRRVGFSRFFGAVEFYGRIPHLTRGSVEFASVTAPKLSEIRRRDRGNLVIGERPLLGPVPYIGGVMEIEIGLFSIKSQDLLKPYLELIDALSNTAGLAFINVAAPYVAAIKKGAAALIESEGTAKLEIGAAVTSSAVQAGTYFAARLDSAGRDLSKFSLDGNGRLIDDRGNPVVDVPYLVFSVTESEVRSDWHQIPAVSAAYNQLMEVIRKQESVEDIDSEVEHFRRVVLTDPDLLPGHAKQLFEHTKMKVEDVTGPTKTSRPEEIPTLPPLSELTLTPL